MLGYYKHRVSQQELFIHVVTLTRGRVRLIQGRFAVGVVRQINATGWLLILAAKPARSLTKNCGLQASVLHYDILENIISRLNLEGDGRLYRREDFLNHELAKPCFIVPFYAVRKALTAAGREGFLQLQQRLPARTRSGCLSRGRKWAQPNCISAIITRIIPNLKLGIEKACSSLWTVSLRTTDPFHKRI